MAKTKKRKASKKEESKDFYENPDVLAEKISRTEEFLEKNTKLVSVIVAVLILGVAAYFGGRLYLNNQNKQAQAEMFQAIFYFESENYNRALNGDGNNYGFLDIIDEYPWTAASKLAHFYAGVCYLNTERYEQAIEHLKKFNPSDWVVQARAYALIGDAHMELGEYSQAARQYERAANYEPNEQFSPTYLRKAGIAYENLADYDAAVKCYDRIVKDFPESGEANNARKQRARLEILASK